MKQLLLATTLALTLIVISPFAHSQTATQAWVQRYSGNVTNSDNEPRAIAVDNSGNAFVAGYSSDVYGIRHWIVLAYSSSGVGLWTNHYDGPEYTESQPNAVAVDASGNIFAAGVVALAGGSSGQDFLIIKYSASGVPLWTNFYNGPGNGNDGALAAVVDSVGNVIVTGISPSTEESFSGAYATIKYSGAGVPLWTNRFHGPANHVGGDAPTDVAVDGSGNVFVTGISYAVNGSADYATVAYSSAGVPLWTNRYNGPVDSDDYARAVAVDGNGNAFVTGESWNGIATDFATIKYSAAGVPLWTNRYHVTSNLNAFAEALAVDGAGNVVVTGRGGGFQSTNGGYATIKYSNAGAALWTNYYNGPETRFGYNDDGRAVAVDSSGNVLVTGGSYATVPVNTFDFATVAYSSAGLPLWTNRYNGPANGDDVPTTKRCLALGPSGSVYVAGITDGDYPSGTYYIGTVKYVIPPLAPTLGIARSNTFVVVSWATNALNFQLQQSTNLSLTNGWVSLTATQSTYNGFISVTIPATNTGRFFRLGSQ